MRQILRLLACAISVAVTAPFDAFGQMPEAEKAPSPTRLVAVIADVFSDETENAKLRAVIYERFVGRGFTPVAAAKAAEVAQQTGALDTGRVSTDPARLARLRVELGASVLLRAANAPEQGKLVVVLVSERGERSQLIDAGHPLEVRQRLQSIAAALLDELGPSGGSEQTSSDRENDASKQTGPSEQRTVMLVPSRPAVEDDELSGPNAVSSAWQARGGVRFSYEARGSVVGMLIEDVRVSDGMASGLENQFGIGLGLGVRLSMFYAPLPDPSLGEDFWAGFRVGLGGDINVLYSREPTGFSLTSAGRDVEFENVYLFRPVVSSHLGVHLGFGAFQGPTIWRGVVLGLTYAPAYVGGLKIGELDFEGQFNFAGTELSIDVTTLEAKREDKPQSQIRLVAYLLPRVTEELPWLLSVGIGAVWY